MSDRYSSLPGAVNLARSSEWHVVAFQVDNNNNNNNHVAQQLIWPSADRDANEIKMCILPAVAVAAISLLTQPELALCASADALDGRAPVGISSVFMSDSS